MTCEPATAQLLRERGFRLTRQRDSIIAALRHASGHVTAQGILQRVRHDHPALNASTVYRTLSLFKNLGLVAETDLGHGELAYTWQDSERHHHLVCQRCGTELELDHPYLETLQRAILRDTGFAAIVDHIALFGLCRACRAGAGAAADGES